MTYPQPNHPEKHPIAICLSRRQPLQPRLLRRIRGARGGTALHAAAWNGDAAVVEQLISAGATVDAADNDGRGPGEFSGRFGSGSDKMTEGVRTWAGDFLLCFGMLSGTRTCC